MLDWKIEMRSEFLTSMVLPIGSVLDAEVEVPVSSEPARNDISFLLIPFGDNNSKWWWHGVRFFYITGTLGIACAK